MSVVSLNRRQMIAASLGGAGLALGWAPRLLAIDTASGAVDIQPLLAIARDGGVNIVAVLPDMGQGVATALPLILAEELDADWDRVTILPYRSGMPTPPISGPGMMLAADSKSVRSWFPILRECAARARGMLVQAAATRWRVEPGACRTDRSTVIHPGGRLRLGYGELATDAAKLAPPDKVTLKPIESFKLIGKMNDRRDVPDKCTGAAIYASDVKLPGMVYASVLQGPLGGSELTTYDAKAALALPRVKRVLVVDGSTLVALAEDTWSAMRALEAAAPQFKPKAAGTGTTLHAAALKAAIGQPGRAFDVKGQASPDLASAAVVEADYSLPFLAHATMEPMNCTVWVKGDSCEVWAPTQSVPRAQTAAARAVGLSEDRVTVHQTLLGGGFGRRAESDFVRVAALIAKEVPAPVRMTWTRAEDTQHDFYRPAYAMRCKGSVAADGAIGDYRVTIAGASILRGRLPAFSGPEAPIDPTAQSSLVPKIYRLPNTGAAWVEVEPPVPVGFWRSVAHSQNIFASECFIDELAHAAQKDPFSFRQALLTDDRMAAVMTKLRELSNWDMPPAKGVGRGVAIVNCYGSYLGQVVECSVADGEIRLHRLTQVVDCGIAVQPGNVVAQIEGGTIFGLSAAMFGEITATDGVVDQSSFGDYRVLTLAEVPQMVTHVMPSIAAPSGIGETGTPAAAPALANALFAATGRRVRDLPLAKVFAA